MASRLFSASKSARRETRKEEPAERPSALPRRPSSSVGAAPPPASTKTSRIPAPQSSSLPRSKAKSAERSTATAQAAAAAKSASHEPEPASRSALNKGLDKSIASGVPTGIPVGMGIRTEISSNNPPLAAPTRHRLRRKASTQNARGKYASSERSDNSNTLPLASTTSSPQPAADPYPDAILGISMPEMTASAAAAAAGPARSATTPTEFATSSSRMATFALQQPHKISTIDITPPTSNFGVPRSSASSSRYSGSPGPFSRTSTPTSASSHSPGLLQAPKFVPRPRPSASPTTSRPPVTRRKLGGSTPKKEEKVESRGLPVVRESQTPSSSSSTVQDGDSNEHSESSQGARKIDKRRPAPTPPLRLSSKKGEPPESSRIARPSKSPSSQQSQPQAIVAAAKSDAPSPNSPPPRPSREGITSLDGLSTSPVIQSNLSRLATTGHKRRESIDHVISSPPSQVEESMASRSMSRRTSSVPSAPSVKSSIPQATTTSSQGHARGREGSASRSESQTGAVAAAASESSDAVVRSPSKSPSRFGLFTRRIKSPSETSIRSPPTKLTKKGPAAGTGHEGYGRYARRGRSTSTTSTAASRNRSTSSGSTSFSVARQPSSRKSSFGSNDGKPELDDFYKERLEPVVIGGGGMIRENRNSQQSGLYQTSSGQSSVGSFASGASSIPYGRPRDFSVGAGSETASQRESRELLPAPRILSKAERTVQSGKTLAHRRSLHRSQLLGEDESVRIPPPINTRAITAPSPAMETYDSTVSSAMQSETSLGMSDDVSEGHEGNWLKPKTKAAKAPAKSKPSRRWNFFQRLQRSPERSPVEMREQFAENSMADEVPVAISAAPLQGRPAAYYTMLDEEDEHEPEQDLESILRNVEGNLHLDEDEEEDEDEEGVEVPIAMSAREQSMLLPSPPQFPTERFQEFVPPSPPRVPLYQSHSAPTQAIAQAQAVARAQAQAQIQALEYAEAEVRNRQQAEPEPEPESSSVRKPSRLQQVGRIPRVVSKRDRLHNPSPRSFSRPFVQQPPVLGLETDTLPFDEWNPSNKPASAPPVSGAVLYDPRQKEFMAFPPRNYSQASGSSSSGTLNLASVTAITPSADAFLGEDEVWNEYDDLLEHVEPTSAEMRSMLSEFPSLGNIRSRHPPTFFPSVQRNQESWQNEEEVLGSSSSSRPLLPPKPDHLTVPVQEVLVASPTSLSELYSGYGNRSSAAKSNPRHSSASMTSGSRYSSQTIISESGSRSSVSSSYVANKRVTQMMAEKTYRASSDSLRFSALMTSRWLSFDRVLFSPAQDEVCNTRGSRVLVLDGLENDDWATYCALTYPDATIYNLAPHKENRMSADGSNAEGWTTPPNMRRISHANIGAPFPFPKGFFSAVVFRFPGVNTAAAYRNAIFECKRVLRPGGYLEMCVLDMDLLNMGDRARRVVRGAKVRLQDACPDVCLSPISDTVMKLLGRRGFENINRCMVGVPVAGAVSKSRAGSMDDVESNSSQERASARKTLAELFAHDYQGQQSIDVMKGQFTGARMVARVGRWWWTHCYEKKMLLSEGDEFNVSESVWNDRALLDECEERETSLRLVVCYAQKPESVRRRTVSV